MNPEYVLDALLERESFLDAQSAFEIDSPSEYANLVSTMACYEDVPDPAEVARILKLLEDAEVFLADGWRLRSTASHLSGIPIHVPRVARAWRDVPAGYENCHPMHRVKYVYVRRVRRPKANTI